MKNILNLITEPKSHPEIKPHKNHGDRDRLSSEYRDGSLEMRGATFRRRREQRHLSVESVAKMIRCEPHVVVAFENGIIMQTQREMEIRLCMLNSRWTGQDLKKI